MIIISCSPSPQSQSPHIFCSPLSVKAFSAGSNGLYDWLCDSVSQFLPAFLFLVLSAITKAATTVTMTVMVMTRTVAVSAMQSWLSTQASEDPASCGGSWHVTLRQSSMQRCRTYMILLNTRCSSQSQLHGLPGGATRKVIVNINKDDDVGVSSQTYPEIILYLLFFFMV